MPAGTTSDHVGYFGDLMATACELSGAEPPPGIDSISFLPTLTGKTAEQKKHAFLYLEFYEQGGKRAVRQGDWKAVRTKWNSNIELYDLAGDPGEQTDLASSHPEVVSRMASLMEQAHRPSPEWPTPKSKN